MVPEYYFNTVVGSSKAEFTDRGSKFIAYVFAIEDILQFKESIALVKKEHPKASHYCFAYRIGTGNLIYRVSDAGEPSGSAGRPILGAIDSSSLTNLLVVVVRYFGGTLLGVPGLINAYKTSAQLAIKNNTIIRKPVVSTIELEFDYTMMNEIMKIVKQTNCTILSQEQGLFCTMKLGIPLEHYDVIVKRIQDLLTVSIKKPVADN
jgi:uncharacterized YigZ family protein